MSSGFQDKAKRGSDSGIETLDGSLSEDYKKDVRRRSFSKTLVHDAMTIALPENPRLFPEQGHLIYMPCVLCTLNYHKTKVIDPVSSCTNSTKENIQLYKCGNHVYVNHWIYFRCSQCLPAQMSKSNNYNTSGYIYTNYYNIYNNNSNVNNLNTYSNNSFYTNNYYACNYYSSHGCNNINSNNNNNSNVNNVYNSCSNSINTNFNNDDIYDYNKSDTCHSTLNYYNTNCFSCSINNSCNNTDCIYNNNNNYSPDNTNDSRTTNTMACPLPALMRMAKFYVEHDIVCPGGPNCSFLLIDPNRFQCYNDVDETIIQCRVKEPLKVSNPDIIGSLLATLPPVDIPTEVKGCHDCVVDGCVVWPSLKDTLFSLSCFLAGVFCKGSFTVIFKVLNLNNESTLCVKAACLLYYKKKTSCHSVDTEILLSRRMFHEGKTCENILPLLGSFRLDDVMFLVSNLQENGTLEEYLNRIGLLSEFKYIAMVEHICSGLKFLHSYNIAHRNLTIDNILVDRTGTLKIAGFGSSCYVQPDTYIKYPFVGYTYAAPELFQTRKFDPLKPDIWAVGIISYYIFRREHMYPDSCISFRRNDPFRNWSFTDLSEHFIQYLLVRDFGQRPDINQALTHTWFSLSLCDI